MAIEALKENVSLHQLLGDEPNTDNSLSPDDLKAYFDRPAEIIRDYLNNTVCPAVNQTSEIAQNAAATAADAFSTAKNARTTAEQANATADNTKQAADIALGLAEENSQILESYDQRIADAERDATDARTVAESAATNAEQAKTVADSAKQIAESVAQRCDDFQQDATDAIERLNTEKLPQPSEPVQVGDYLQVAEVDEQGRITALVAVDAPSGGGSGLPMALRVAIYNLLMDAAYQSSGHESDKAALAELLTGGGSGDEPDTGKTVTSISATYSGGNVTVGTAVTDLTGIVVTAHYSDGTSAVVTDYALSGIIAEGENTITVIYDGKTTTFTVTGIAAGGNAVNLYSGELLKNSNISGITQNGNVISYTADANGGTATFTIENLEANKDYTIFVESTRTDDGGRYTMVSVNTGSAANYSGKLVTVYPSYAAAGNNYGTFTANGETMYLWCNEVGANVMADSVTLTVYIYEGVLTEKP